MLATDSITCFLPSAKMRTISPAVLLGVLGTIARLSLAQCQPGEEVTPDGGCCPVNTKYFQSDSGKEYACCSELQHPPHVEADWSRTWRNLSRQPR